MITVKNLNKVYRSHTRNKNLITDILFRQYKEILAIDDISFEIDENELVGFIGPNGAGKTTTLKILAGILYPTRGNINVLGYIPFEKKANFLKSISFIMGQRNQLIWDLPATDTFMLNKEIYEIPDGDFNHRLDELSTLLEVTELVNKPVKTLSLGERMKMEFIAGLLHQPKVVFLDEPTIGLDIFSQESIRNFIKTYQEEFKATIILTSHYMEDVKRLAKRLIIIDHGHILYNGNLRTILEEYSHEKRVTAILDKPIKETEMKAVGIPVSRSPLRLVYMIKKIELPEKVRLITKTFPLSDLTIEDEPIEEIIKTFFKKSGR